MVRTFFWTLMLLVPVGWCARNGASRVWRNRRGGRVVFASDVLANAAELFHMTVFRVPEGSRVFREKHGRLAGTLSPGERRAAR